MMCSPPLPLDGGYIPLVMKAVTGVSRSQVTNKEGGGRLPKCLDLAFLLSPGQWRATALITATVSSPSSDTFLLNPIHSRLLYLMICPIYHFAS